METVKFASLLGSFNGRLIIVLAFVLFGAGFSSAFGDTFVPSLYPTGAYPNWSIDAENTLNPNSAVVNAATATVVTDPGLSIYNSADWYDASGATVSLPTGSLDAGATDVPWGGSITLGADQWLLITATFDGSLDYSAYYGTADDPGSEKKEKAKPAKVGNVWKVEGHVAGNLSKFTASGADDTSSPGGNWSATWNSDPGTVDLYWARAATGGWNKVYTTGAPVVPEPSTLALLGIGAISLLACACRRRRQAE